MKKTALLLFFVIASFFAIGFTGCAAQKNDIPIPQTRSGTHIYDNGNLLDDGQEQALNRLCLELKNKTQATLAVLTVNGMNGYDIETYANEVFNGIGIGQKGVDDGVLLLVSKPEGKQNVRIEVGRGLESINDAQWGRILDEYFVPHRERGNYAAAIDQTTAAIVVRVANEYGVSISADGITSNDIKELEHEQGYEMPSWLMILIVVIAIIVSIFTPKRRRWYGGGGFFGGGRGGRGGGGFGGGSFGGGGFSGGGGASR